MNWIVLNALVRVLHQKGVCFEVGLSDEEIAHIEQRYHLRFPLDLCALLQYALPTGDKFLDWRDDSEESIVEKLNAPYEGIYFDIEYNDFWWDAWGRKPTRLNDALTVAKETLGNVPRLIPIYSHRYIPQEPALTGNPIFSVMQTDVIYYGNDLVSYFAKEFHLSGFEGVASPRYIEFWSELAEG